MTMGSPTSEVEVQDRIHRFLRDHLGAYAKARVVPLTGDASDRRYFRLIHPGGGPALVLAVHAGAFEFASLPFANVAELFRHVPLPVPEIVGHSGALGILALQDLGDVTLQAHLGTSSARKHAEIYRQAVAFIERLQRRGAELASDRYIPYSIAFDVGKLTWELDVFVRHFVEGYRGVTLAEAERAALAEEWLAVAPELAGERRVLCHRDYHSRNLMVRADGLYVIDFQDARMGPDTYDLASLLRDSYVDIVDDELDDLVGDFLALRQRRGGNCAGESPDEFRRRFDLMSLQRNLKALGTFGYQTAARRNPVYIQYMPRTLSYARANLTKYPRFARLHELLARHLKDLR